MESTARPGKAATFTLGLMNATILVGVIVLLAQQQQEGW
jgi:hypothetical protein